MNTTREHDRYGLADPAGKWLLDNDPTAYGAHGFVYADGKNGTIIATGGDAAITVGIYANEQALTDGNPLALYEWHVITAHLHESAIAVLKNHTAN